jgi:hypothetical protein
VTEDPARDLTSGRRIRPIAPGEQAEVVAVLTEAFHRDPLGERLYPDPIRRRAGNFSFFSELLAELEPGAIVDVTDECDAVAIWHAPGVKLHISGGPDASPPVAALFAAVAAATPPQPFWYLGFLAARQRGAGAGSALLRHRLATIDGPVALWTGNEANLAFYARFGLRPVSEHRAEGVSAWWLAGTAGSSGGA